MKRDDETERVGVVNVQHWLCVLVVLLKRVHVSDACLQNRHLCHEASDLAPKWLSSLLILFPQSDIAKA